MATLNSCLGIAGKRKEVAAKTEETLAPDFWGDPKAAETFLKKLSGIKSWITDYDKACSLSEDLEVLYEFAKDSLDGADDEAVETAETRELDVAYAQAVEAVEALELRNMLGGEGDNLGAVLTINSGAGGTEANDWSAMLMRMYLRWGERNGYKMTVTTLLEGEEAGIKSTTIEVEGDYAYGYLKAETACIGWSGFPLSTRRASARPLFPAYSCIRWSMIPSISRSTPRTWNGILSAAVAMAAKM